MQRAGDVLGVGGDAAQRVRWGDDGAALPLQPFDHAVPARGVGEGSVHQDDGRLGARGPGGLYRGVHGGRLRSNWWAAGTVTGLVPVDAPRDVPFAPAGDAATSCRAGDDSRIASG